jgi:hypothetical protein
MSSDVLHSYFSRPNTLLEPVAGRDDGVAELVLLSLLPLSVLLAGLFPNFRTENRAV